MPETGAAKARSSSITQPDQLSLDLNSPTVAIRLQGKLISVKVRGNVPHEDYFLFATLDVSSLGLQTLLRYVCMISNPNVVAGWASSEYLWLKEDAFDRVVALP